MKGETQKTHKTNDRCSELTAPLKLKIFRPPHEEQMLRNSSCENQVKTNENHGFCPVHASSNEISGTDQQREIQPMTSSLKSIPNVEDEILNQTELISPSENHVENIPNQDRQDSSEVECSPMPSIRDESITIERHEPSGSASELGSHGRISNLQEELNRKECSSKTNSCAENSSDQQQIQTPQRRYPLRSTRTQKYLGESLRTSSGRKQYKRKSVKQPLKSESTKKTSSPGRRSNSRRSTSKKTPLPKRRQNSRKRSDSDNISRCPACKGVGVAGKDFEFSYGNLSNGFNSYERVVSKSMHRNIESICSRNEYEKFFGSDYEKMVNDDIVCEKNDDDISIMKIVELLRVEDRDSKPYSKPAAQRENDSSSWNRPSSSNSTASSSMTSHPPALTGPLCNANDGSHQMPVSTMMPRSVGNQGSINVYCGDSISPNFIFVGESKEFHTSNIQGIHKDSEHKKRCDDKNTETWKGPNL